MNSITNAIAKAWSFLGAQIRGIGFADIIDILIVTVLLYYVYKFIRERRAEKLAIGVGILLIALVVSDLLNFMTLNFIMKNIFQVGLIAAVIIFQPELRSMLESVGGDSIRGIKSIGENKTQASKMHFIDELCEAVSEMSMSKTGALIVLERTTKLGDIIATGTTINAEISSLLLRNIFFNKSPLHDGAVIIRENRVYAAGCVLPLATKNSKIDRELGTRHRAAIGVSEVSDAFVIVVSEENGVISLAHKGVLEREYDQLTLKIKLEKLLSDENTRAKKIFRKKAQKD